jgi:MFS family permease
MVAAERRQRPVALQVVTSSCVVLVIGMVAAVNLAVPDLGASRLTPTSSALLWIVDAYVIVFACLLVPAGALGDRFGQRSVLIAGLSIFALGAGLSAAAPDVAVLLLGRGLTGVGAAGVLPSTLAVVVGAATTERRPAAIATWAAMTGVGGALGNALGGLLISAGGWRLLFAGVVPVALILLGAVWVLAPRTARIPRPIHAGSVLLLVAGSLGVFYGIIEGPERGWLTPPVVVAFILGALVLSLWVEVERRTAEPLLDPRLFRVPLLRASCLGMMATFFGMFALFFVNAQYLQYGKSYSVIATGLGIAPMSVALLLVTRLAAPLVARIGARRTLTLAFLGMVIGLLMISTATQQTPYLQYLVYLTVTALGCGLALPVLSNGIVSSLPADRAGAGSGLQSMARELGSALGVAVVGSASSARFSAALPRGFRAHGQSTPRTVATALSRIPIGDAARHDQVLHAFVVGMTFGLRVVACAAILLATLTVLGYPRDLSQPGPKDPFPLPQPIPSARPRSNPSTRQLDP